MWLNWCGKRCQSGARFTATSSRTRSNSCITLSLSGSKRLCSSMSNRANSSWRTVAMPLWKFFAASIFSNSARGSGSPVSTCAVIACTRSHSQQKFSMNWLGSSTASHSTPLIPATGSSPMAVSSWCSPWPISWNRVVTSSWLKVAGLPSTPRPKLQTR